MSEGRELGGCCGGRGEGRGAGRGIGVASTGLRNDSGFGVVAAGLGVLTGSAFSLRFSFGVGDFSGSGLLFFEGVAVPLAFGVGVTSSSSSADFLAVDFALGFGVAVSSSSSSEGVFFAFGFGVGVGVAFFFDFDFRAAGFGFAVGSGVSEGVGEVTARISSRAFFFFSSVVDWARTNAVRRATRTRTVPRRARSRITGRERNRGDPAIKRAVEAPGLSARRARVRAARSHSIFRRGEAAGRSDTSRS
jgi:hypothetical protein